MKKIEPQVSQLLQLLLLNPQEVCTKETMLDTIWKGRVVTDDSVRALVRKLRDELGDDIKAPVFIKTHPRIGYQLICDIRCENEQSTATKITDPCFVIVGTGILVVFGIVASLTIWNWPSKDPEIPPAYSVTPLTQLPGSELAPDYSSHRQRLLFSYRDSHNALLSLYAKDLKSGTVQRLSHDDYNYINALWSSDGNSVIYSRFLEQESQHYRAKYDAVKGLVAPEPLAEELNQWYLKSKGQDDKLYLASVKTPRGIAVWEPKVGQITRLTSPEQGEGDIYAAESGNGKQLAIIRAIAPEQRQLLILDLVTGTLEFSDDLPLDAYRLIWSDNDQSLIIGAFNGELVSLSLQDNSYSEFDLVSLNINHPFHDCGPQCIFARQHNGNYVDIAEQSNPFVDNNQQALLSISSNGVEDFPMYGTQGTVFFVQQQKDGQWLMVKQRNAAPKKLFLLPADGLLQALSINNAKTHLAGKLGGRVFYFELERLHFQWLSQVIDYYPHFVDDGQVVQFTSKESGIFKSHFFDVLSGESYSVADDIQFVWESGKKDEGTRIFVDAQNQLWGQKHGQSETFLLTLPSASPNRFKIVGDKLYFTDRIGNTAWLSRLSLSTFELDKREFAKNRLKLHFDVSADNTRILGVNSVLAQSNLVKVELAVAKQK